MTLALVIWVLSAQFVGGRTQCEGCAGIAGIAPAQPYSTAKVPFSKGTLPSPLYS